MNELFEFSLIVILVSASGVMAPGPLLATNIVYGLKQGYHAGLKIAIGHSVVELPLIILLGIGAFSLQTFPEFRIIIGIVGAITLFVFAGIQIKTIVKHKESTSISHKQGPILAGILFSALNPFFIVWWLSVGFKLISDAMLIWSFWGIIILFVVHIWMDFAWLGGVAYLASRSARIISNIKYKILMIVLSGALVYFGITFLLDALPKNMI